MSTLLRNWDIANQAGISSFSAGFSGEMLGQTFVGDGRPLSSVKFWIKPNTTAGSCQVRLFATPLSGTPGTVLASSGFMSNAGLSTSTYQAVTFTFASPYTLTNGVTYCIALATSAGGVLLAIDNSAPTYGGVGDAVYYQVEDLTDPESPIYAQWNTFSYDCCFEVYVDAAAATTATLTITEANETAAISTTVTTNALLALIEANETTLITTSQSGTTTATIVITEANETVLISGRATQPASIIINEANETISIIGNATGTATPTPMAIKLGPFFSTDIIDPTGPIFQLYKINASGVMVADYGPNSTDIVAIPNVVNGYAAILTDANMTVDTDGGYRGAIVWSTGGETPMYIVDEFYIPPTATGSGGTLDSTTLAQIAAIKAKTDNLPAAPADESLIIAATNAIVSDTATIKAKTNQLTFTVANQVDSNALTGGGSISAASVRAAIGMASANLDTQLAALPTVTALSTALGTADDATLAQIALVKAKTDNLPAAPAAASDCISAAGVRAAVGLATANLDTQLDALPTNTELATALASADDATLIQIAALPSATAIRNAVLDASQAAHMTAGTIGAGIAAASSSGDPWATVLPGGYAVGTAGYKIGTASNMGAGAITWPYTLTNTQTGLPIADVKVWATTDIEGFNVIASGLTDQNGSVTFYLDAGTVYLFRQKSGVNFTNPDVEVIA